MRKYKKDELLLSGIFLLALSLLVFCFQLFRSIPTDEMVIFLITFGVTLAYFITILAYKRRKSNAENLPSHAVFLILFLISAYSLNRTMNVFEDSADWLSVLLVLSSANLLLFSVIDNVPNWLKHVMFFLLGITICLFTYLAIYLLPLYPYGLLGFFLLGISLHTFVPLLLVLLSVRMLKLHSVNNRRLKFTSFAAIGSAVLFISIYLIIWNNNLGQINLNYRQALVHNDNLPAWVEVARKTDDNIITERILQSGLTYSVPNQNFSFPRMPRMNFERHQHDPLVMLASFICGRPAIETEDRIKVLETRFDARHNTEPRLWSGDNLKTEFVHTELRLWPEYAVAYTEKTITVANDAGAGRRSQGEAIYSFQLPEGGVVTSLSLWINGKEEKGILTTKGKADTAYTTIVGVESRDPSLVKWQEGNKVSVRIFPVEGGSRRTFKIGVTSPLKSEGKEFLYENITFKGPAQKGTEETVQVAFTNPVEQHSFATLSSSDAQHFERSGKFQQNWLLRFANPGLSGDAFSFKGHSYRASLYTPAREKVEFENIYLDLNSAWTKSEYDEIVSMASGKKLFAYNDGLIEITRKNKEWIFTSHKEDLFSLFPFYLITDPQKSIVISKSNEVSPALTDLDGFDFLRLTKAHLTQSTPVRLYNISSTISPYLRTLLEYRAFNYAQGDTRLLNDLLTQSTYPVNQEDNSHVVLPNSKIMITETSEASPLATPDHINQTSEGAVSAAKSHATQINEGSATTAPDHLLRLFAYNHLMQAAGKRMLDKVPEDDALVEEAKLANIVSPVSSLIVLETEEDYKRFGITQSTDALGNATLKSKGAVPEPHEWLLIIAGAIALFYIRIKMRFTGARN